MGSMSAAHWLIVLLIVLLVFGPKRLGSLGKGMGEGIRSFREGLAGEGGDHDARRDTHAMVEKDKPREEPPY